jgi:hypothetical protein
MAESKKSKNDEFYTQFQDIQVEIFAYLDRDPNVFRGKTVLLPCDDPEWSNFTKFFAQNFESLGLKKLISTSYAPNSKPQELNIQPTLFEIESPQFDEDKFASNGKIFSLERDTTGDNVINVEDLEWRYLEGDGDFRSEEITQLRDEADIIITNPPFSLFREFLDWITTADKQFVILGNMNAITYKEVFPLIKDDRMWLGVTRTGVGSMWFEVAEGAPEKTGQIIEGGKRLQTIGNSAWFTNIDHGRRHEPLPLMTMEDNIKFSKHKEIKGLGYLPYDNYDGIEVSFTDAIPSDYEGVMGVPITFLGKYNPEQFEIVSLSRYQGTGMKKEFVDAYFASGQTGQISEGHPDLSYYDRDGRPVVPYRRILIRHRGAHK